MTNNDPSAEKPTDQWVTGDDEPKRLGERAEEAGVVDQQAAMLDEIEENEARS